MINWKDPATRDRLMAALVASIGHKGLNYRRIASFFDQGATYDAIEGQFRAIRKLAAQLTEEAEDGTGNVPDPPSRRGGAQRRRKADGAPGGAGAITKAKKTVGSSPRRDAVLGGRITKSKSITPTNNANKQPISDKNAVKGFKQEIESSDASVVGTPANSFNILGYDGACDSFLSNITYDLGGFENSFAGFPSDDSYVFEA